MNSFVLASPMILTMAFSIWLGWRGRVRLFVVWLVLCTGVAAFSIHAFLQGYVFSSVGMMMLGAVVMFLASGFGIGFLAKRARHYGANNG